MKTPFLPASRAGKWSTGLMLGAVLVFLLLILFGELLNLLPDGLISVAGALAIAAAIMASITGLSALIRRKDRCVLVYLAVLIGLTTIVFILTSIWSDARGLPD